MAWHRAPCPVISTHLQVPSDSEKGHKNGWEKKEKRKGKEVWSDPCSDCCGNVWWIHLFIMEGGGEGREVRACVAKWGGIYVLVCAGLVT